MTGGGASCLPAKAEKIQGCHSGEVAEGRFELGTFCDLRDLDEKVLPLYYRSILNPG
jgi:hypothetical protein